MRRIVVFSRHCFSRITRGLGLFAALVCLHEIVDGGRVMWVRWKLRRHFVRIYRRGDLLLRSFLLAAARLDSVVRRYSCRARALDQRKDLIDRRHAVGDGFSHCNYLRDIRREPVLRGATDHALDAREIDWHLGETGKRALAPAVQVLADFIDQRVARFLEGIIGIDLKKITDDVPDRLRLSDLVSDIELPIGISRSHRGLRFALPIGTFHLRAAFKIMHAGVKDPRTAYIKLPHLLP